MKKTTFLLTTAALITSLSVPSFAAERKFDLCTSNLSNCNASSVLSSYLNCGNSSFDIENFKMYIKDLCQNDAGDNDITEDDENMENNGGSDENNQSRRCFPCFHHLP